MQGNLFRTIFCEAVVSLLLSRSILAEELLSHIVNQVGNTC